MRIYYIQLEKKRKNTYNTKTAVIVTIIYRILILLHLYTHTVTCNQKGLCSLQFSKYDVIDAVNDCRHFQSAHISLISLPTSPMHTKKCVAV